MKKYILIEKKKSGIEYDIFTSYEDLIAYVEFAHSMSSIFGKVTTKWYRVDNITFDKLDAIVDTFAKFVHSINKEIN